MWNKLENSPCIIGLRLRQCNCSHLQSAFLFSLGFDHVGTFLVIWSPLQSFVVFCSLLQSFAVFCSLLQSFAERFCSKNIFRYTKQKMSKKCTEKWKGDKTLCTFYKYDYKVNNYFHINQQLKKSVRRHQQLITNQRIFSKHVSIVVQGKPIRP